MEEGGDYGNMIPIGTKHANRHNQEEGTRGGIGVFI